MKILVIDDEQDILDLLRDLFKSKGHAVDCASSGKLGLEIIDKNRPDVVLLDIKMPEMGGVQTLEEIKKKDSSIEVAMLTGYGYNDALIKELTDKGASGYISKNLPLQHIVNTFNTLLKSMSLKKR